MRSICLIALLLAAVLVAGCCGATKPAETSYIVNSQGAVSAATRSAMDGSTAPGKQEIIGIYLPFIGTGLAAKAALEWDGTPGTITVPVGPFQQGAGSIPQQQVVNVPQNVVVPQNVTVQQQSVDSCGRATIQNVQTTQYVPAARLVPLPVPAQTYALPGCR